MNAKVKSCELEFTLAFNFFVKIEDKQIARQVYKFYNGKKYCLCNLEVTNERKMD